MSNAKKIKRGGFLQGKLDLYAAGFEEGFVALERLPCEASGETLNRLAEEVTGIARSEGEGDASYRARISSALTLDEDARFADKVAAAVKDFDAEEEEAEL